MNVLYVSSLSSKRLVSNIYKATGKNPGYSIQKFSRLLVQGFINNQVSVSTLSVIPIQSRRPILVNKKRENEDNITFNYIPYLNIPILKHICICLYAFVFVVIWGIKNRKDGRIVFDVLRISPSIGALCASKLVRIPTVGIVTDMPGLMVGTRKKWYSTFITFINKSYLNAFSYYVFLTEQMNNVINRKNRPYIVMEGLVDSSMSTNVAMVTKKVPKTLLYAGGLHVRYGLKMLVDAFVELNHSDWQLEIYGSGPYVDELQSVCMQHPNVVYKGVVPNDDVVVAEYEASLLVNPRPTVEAFTQYSFPSKNMEYMVSGTPLLTTKLPGMPQDYYDYVYLLEDETKDGYRDRLQEIFAMADNDLLDKGAKAKSFVLDCKNNIAQANRIIKMCR